MSKKYKFVESYFIDPAISGNDEIEVFRVKVIEKGEVGKEKIVGLSAQPDVKKAIKDAEKNIIKK